MGLVYTQKGHVSSSLVFCEEALKLASTVSSEKTPKLQTNIYVNMGYSYLLLQN